MTGEAAAGRLRADKWLCFARFFKTRSLAAGLIEGGRLRVNGSHASRPAQPVGPGDVLTFPQGSRIRVIRVLALPERRGPPSEAQALYEDLDPPVPPGAGQPSAAAPEV